MEQFFLKLAEATLNGSWPAAFVLGISVICLAAVVIAAITAVWFH